MASQKKYIVFAVIGIAAASGAAWWFQKPGQPQRSEAPADSRGGAAAKGGAGRPVAVEAVAVFVGDPGLVRRVKVRFSRPVLPEDTVTFQGRVTAIAEGRLTTEVTATNQRGEPVLRGAVVETSLG